MVVTLPESDTTYWTELQESVLLGFYSVFRLYDRSLNTTMEETVEGRVDEVVETLSEQLDTVSDHRPDDHPS